MSKSIIYYFTLILSFNCLAITPKQQQLEDYLGTFPLNTEKLGFKKLNGSTKYNFMVKQNGSPIFNLKCTQKNTFHKAAVVVYELGKLLNIELFPVAKLVNVNRRINYYYHEVGKLIENSVYLNQVCVLKEWVEAFAPYYWAVIEDPPRNSFVSAKGQKKKLVEWLRCENKNLANSEFKFYSKSRNGLPKASFLDTNSKYVVYTGISKLNAVARDFSNMMLMDAIIGNDDRFPGGNIHFIPGGEIQNKRDKIYFEDTKLFSLDNESALRGSDSLSMTNFTTYVSRFDRNVVTKLMKLKENLNNYTFLNGTTWKKHDSLKDYLLSNIEKILKHVEHSEKICGINSTYF